MDANELEITVDREAVETTFNVDEVTTNQSHFEDDGDPAETLPFSRKSPKIIVQSVKEYEEQLRNLKKENFKLKFMIYEMEKRLNLINQPKDIEEALKKNIELSVDNETLQNELKENKSLLSQALKALDLIEQERDKSEKLKENEITFYKSKIQEFEQILKNIPPLQSNEKLIDENKALQFQINNLKLENADLNERLDIKDKQIEQDAEELKEMQRKLIAKDEEIRSLNHIHDEKCQRLDEMTRRNTQLHQTTETLTKQLKNNMTREKKYSDLETRLDKELGHSRTLESKLEKQQQELKRANDSSSSFPSSQTLKADIKLLEEQIVMQEKRYKDLKIENERALIVIREFVKRDKKDTLPEEIQKRDEEILKLKKHIKVLKDTFLLRPDEFRKSAGGENMTTTTTGEKQRDNREYESVDNQSEEHSAENHGSTPKSTLISKYLQQITEMQTQLKDYLYDIEEKDKLIEQLENNNLIEKTKLETLLQDRDKEIQKLEAELRKRTVNLQQLVNTELWDKNREIERQLRKTHTSFLNNGSGDDNNKQLNKRIDELTQNNTTIEIELKQLKTNYEICQQSKNQAIEMCVLLTKRLEELAMFLNNLLQNKSMLGFLGIETQELLKGVVEKSLNASRSFHISFNDSVLPPPENTSLLQLSHLTDLLDISKKSFNDLCDPLHITTKSYIDHSESEEYSEPDRNVSQARIGLNNTLNHSERSPNSSSSSSEEGEGEVVITPKVTPKSVKRSLFTTSNDKTFSKEISKLQIELQEKTNALLHMERNFLEIDNELQQFKLEHIKFKDLKSKLEESENERKSLESKLTIITKTVEELQQEKSNLKIDFENEIKKCTQLIDEKNQLKEMFDKLQLDYCETNTKLQEFTTKLEHYKLNYIPKDVYNEILQSLDVAQQQIIKLQQLLQQSEYKIQIFEENETKMTIRLQELILKNNDSENLLKQIIDLEMNKNQLEVHVSKLEMINADLENQLVKVTTDNSSSSGTLIVVNKKAGTYSGYSSEDIGEVRSNNNNNNWLNVNDDDLNERTVNSSPDLGIESDQGRFSSLETNNQQMRPFLPPLQLTQTMNSMLTNVTSNDSDPMTSISEIQKLREENLLLKSKLVKTRKTLEDTVQQLTKSNERKKQVEKAVCKQIYKTSLVLRKARANLDSDYENNIPPAPLPTSTTIDNNSIHSSSATNK